MRIVPKSVQRLIDEFGRLPGIGPKSAQRLTFYLLRGSKQKADELGNAILDLKSNIKICSTCSNLAESDPCIICGDERRDHSTIMVVEEPLDILAFEKTGKFEGVYHVLHGVISPVEGIGPDDLYIKQLLDRLHGGDVGEVIIATNINVEGEATAMYLQKLIGPLDVRVTRIAHGLPVGSDIEYADEITLTKALENRGDY
ncbi:MAG: recombination mediator RecR [Patescibacteria group bacterium]|nr:recombination mediator RecR [Patescibacteria group bacterium]